MDEPARQDPLPSLHPCFIQQRRQATLLPNDVEYEQRLHTDLFL